MPAEHRLSADERARWRARFVVGWQGYWEAHREADDLVSRDAVDAAISWAVEKQLVDQGEAPRGCSAGQIKKFRTEGTAVPAKASVSRAIADVLDDPGLHGLWSGDLAPAGSGRSEEPMVPSGAVATAEVAAALRAGDGPAVDDELAEPGTLTEDGAGGGRPWWVVPVAVVAAVLLIGIAALALTRSGETVARSNATSTTPATATPGSDALAATEVAADPGGTTPTAATVACASEPGEVVADLESAPEQPEWERSLVRAYDAAGGDTSIGCTTGPAERVGDVVVQHLAVDGVPAGVLLARADVPKSAWWFSGAFWGNYHQVFTRQPYAVGVPASGMELDAEGLLEVQTSLGGVFVAERQDAPFYLVSHLHAGWWRSHPELGRPTSHPDPALSRQDFEFGYGSLRVGELTEADPYVVPDRAAELPDGPIEGHILRQSDTTTWWIPEPGVRQWIPDGDTWNCLGGNDVTIMKADGTPADVPGYALATLRFDGVARCPSP